MRNSLALALTLLASPALGQGQLQTIVVPSGAGVVVPPRGDVPRLTARPPGTPRPLLPSTSAAVPTSPSTGGVAALSLGAVILPAVAAALLGGAAAGSGGGNVSGPARTR